MSNLNSYISSVKKHIEEHPDMSENEIIRYVYLVQLCICGGRKWCRNICI